MPELTENFPKWARDHEDFEDRTLELFEALVTLLGEANAPNIEQILTFLDDAQRFKEEPYSKAVKAWARPFGANSEELSTLAGLIRTYILETFSVTLQSDAFAYLSGLMDFQSKDVPLDIFTLNYDRLVEATCARQAIRFTTGFSDVWDPDLFSSSPGWGVRLFKLHGSVNWRRVAGGGPIYQGDGTHHAFAGVSSSQALLYPAGAKAAHADPFATLMSFFSNALQDADFLVAMGYSFQDDHIRRMVLDRLVTNRNLQVLVANPTAEDILDMPRTDPTAATFGDFPDRVMGLWFGTRSALENRMIFHRIEEVEGVDGRIAAFQQSRSRRDFPSAAEEFLRTLHWCRIYQLSGKMSRILTKWGEGDEFRTALNVRIRGNIASVLSAFSIEVPEALEGLSSSREGGQESSIVTLLEMVTLSEIYDFEDVRSLAEDALRAVVSFWIGGLAVGQGVAAVGWPVSIGENIERRLQMQRSQLGYALQGLVDRPPILVSSDRGRLGRPALFVSGLTLLQRYHEIIAKGHESLTYGSNHVLGPMVQRKHWRTALIESTEGQALGEHALVRDWCPRPELIP